MSEDTLRRYGVSPQIGQAAMNMLYAMSRREGCDLPSSDVIDKALRVLGADPATRGVSHNVAPAIVYKVPSSSEPVRKHLVALYTQNDGRSWDGFTQPKIIDAECSCKATTTCWHLLTALTYAENDGYHLDIGRDAG